MQQCFLNQEFAESVQKQATENNKSVSEVLLERMSLSGGQPIESHDNVRERARLTKDHIRNYIA